MVFFISAESTDRKQMYIWKEDKHIMVGYIKTTTYNNVSC